MRSTSMRSATFGRRAAMGSRPDLGDGFHEPSKSILLVVACYKLRFQKHTAGELQHVSTLFQHLALEFQLVHPIETCENKDL